MEHMEFWDWVYRTTYQREMNMNRGYAAALSSSKKAADGALKHRQEGYKAALVLLNELKGVASVPVPVGDGKSADE